MVGKSSRQGLQETGLALHAMDVMVFFDPLRYFGDFVMMSFPCGHRREETTRRNVAQRRKVSMVRAVGDTLCVDPLFPVTSVVTAGWDDNVMGLVLFSALFSVLELVTELQYSVTEVEDARPRPYATVGDNIELGVARSAVAPPG